MQTVHSAPPSRNSQVEDASEFVRIIVFTIAGYRLGLPIDHVLRVVNCPFQVSASNQLVELLHLGHHAITVVNLHHRLATNQAPQAPSAGQFLVVTTFPSGEFCAIRVDTPPDLVDISPTVIRKLPEPYSQGHPLSIAHQVAVLPQGKATLAVFLLDMQRVLEAVSREQVAVS